MAKGKPSQDQKSKAKIKTNLRQIVETEVERLRVSNFNLRENVREALGVGNWRDYVKEVETNFALTIPQKPDAIKTPKPSVRKLSKTKQRRKK